MSVEEREDLHVTVEHVTVEHVTVELVTVEHVTVEHVTVEHVTVEHNQQIKTFIKYYMYWFGGRFYTGCNLDGGSCLGDVVRILRLPPLSFST